MYKHCHFRTIAVVFAFLGLAMVLTLPALLHGPLITHSSRFNTIWAEGFAGELAKGIVYPRWLPGVNDGMGSPVFYFYGSFPLYVAAPFVWLTGNAAAAVALASGVLLWLSALGGYALFRQVSGPNASVVGAIAYMTMPYHFFSDVWVRGAFGEQAAFVFLPLALCFVMRIRHGTQNIAGLAISVAGLAFSHLPSTLIAIPFIGCIALWQGAQAKSLRVVLRAAAGGGLGLAAAAFYIWPAIQGQRFIKPEYWDAMTPAQNAIGLFASRFELVLLAGLLPSQLVFGLCSLALIRAGRWQSIKPWVLSGMVALLLVTPLAAPFWNHAGLFARIQFPWRLLTIFDLVTCLLLAAAWDTNKTAANLSIACLVPAFLSIAGFVSMMSISPDSQTGSYLQVAPEIELRQLAVRADALEYLPACAPLEREFAEGAGSAVWFIPHLQSQQVGKDVLRFFYYPFLVAEQGGREVQLRCDPKTGLSRLVDSAVDASAARVHQVMGKEERQALMVTLMALLVIAVLVITGERRRRSVEAVAA